MTAPLAGAPSPPLKVLRMGSFGGSYFRPIRSSVMGGALLSSAWEDGIPKAWLAGLNVKRQVANPMYEADVNRYGVKCGKCGHDDR